MSKSRKAVVGVAKLKAFKPAGVDMGTLQKEVADAKRDAKAKAKALQNALEADVAAKARVSSAVEAFQSASRAVLAG